MLEVTIKNMIYTSVTLPNNNITAKIINTLDNNTLDDIPKGEFITKFLAN